MQYSLKKNMCKKILGINILKRLVKCICASNVKFLHNFKLYMKLNARKFPPCKHYSDRIETVSFHLIRIARRVKSRVLEYIDNCE